MLLQRHFLNHAAQGVDLRPKQIGLDREHFARRRLQRLRRQQMAAPLAAAAGAAVALTRWCGCCSRRGRGRRLGVGRWVIGATGFGGVLLLPGLNRKTPDMAKMTNRIRRWKSIGAFSWGWNSVRGGIADYRSGSGRLPSRGGTGSYPPACHGWHREPASAEGAAAKHAVFGNRLGGVFEQLGKKRQRPSMGRTPYW